MGLAANRVKALVAAGWGLSVVAAQPVGGGLINLVWKLTATDGTCWFLKEYAPDLRDSAAFTLGIQEWVRERGLPVPEVLPTAAGNYVYRHADGAAALSTFLPGQALQPGDLSRGHLAAMGDVLARLHLALLDHPGSAGPARAPTDTTSLEQAIQGVEAMVQRQPFSAEVDALVRRCLATKREAVARWQLGPHLYSGATWQLLHKDFRLENLLFDPSGGVSAVLDFDFAREGYRAWELMRAAMTAAWLNEGMDLERAGVLLRAYLVKMPVTPAELQNLGRLWLDSLVRTFWPISLPYEAPADWHDGLAQILRDRDEVTRWFSDHLEEVEAWLAGLGR
ncbi:MAG: phosphotransferase enzyme family protein [Symbiobacteriia bacterium]